MKISVGICCQAGGWEDRRNGGKEKGRRIRLLVTNSDFSRALWTALPSYRLLRLRFTHDGQQRLQQHIQQALHHHLHLFLYRALLRNGTGKHRFLNQSWKWDTGGVGTLEALYWLCLCTSELLLIMEKMLLRIPEQMRSSFCCLRCRWIWCRTTGSKILLDSVDRYKKTKVNKEGSL